MYAGVLWQVAVLLLRVADVLQSGGQPRPQLLLLGDLPGVWLQLWRLLLQQVHLLLGRPHLL